MQRHSFAMLFSSLFLACLALTGLAAPVSANNAAPTSLSAAELASLVVPARFVRAAYCKAAPLAALACGPNCKALGDTEIAITGGDDTSVPRFYVAYDRGRRTVVVSYKGLNAGNMCVL